MFSVTFCFTNLLFVTQILGPDSGWQPIPLTDVITAAAAKKAYRRATLCVHPDKLQQRGASIQQKYICEKVFDLLKVCDFLYTGLLPNFLFSHSTWQSAILRLLLLKTLICVTWTCVGRNYGLPFHFWWCRKHGTSSTPKSDRLESICNNVRKIVVVKLDALYLFILVSSDFC